MQLTTFFLFCATVVGIVSANDYYKLLADNALSLVIRQTQTCTNSSSCEECFGPGNVRCYNSHCYNPSAGESCCSGGNYCPAGKTCVAISGGCCNTGQSIADCAASLGVPIPTSTTAATSTATGSHGSSNDKDDTIAASEWIADHKAIIGGAAAGIVVLLILFILLCCCACRRRSKSQSGSQPPMSGTYYQNNGQYYQPPSHQSVHY